MASEVFDLPSGAKLELRALKGREGKILSDKAAVKSGTFLDKILRGCTVEVLDAGPYDVESGGVFDWGRALVGDRFFAMMQIRILSLGKIYTFKTQCPESMCRHRFELDVDLSELPVRRLAKADREAFKNGNEFVTTSPSDGREIRFRLSLGTDEQAAAKAKSLDGALLSGLQRRIISIAPEDSEGVVDVRKYLEDMPYADVLRLLKAFDEHDCGIQTEMEVACPECETIQDFNIPFVRDFLVPRLSSSTGTGTL